ncbi:MAG: hypothetical protein LBP99_00080 [Azoarcus sp.]|jgi:hypothetical protein|nr:hypothetical protein [Azoarcus sp.]
MLIEENTLPHSIIESAMLEIAEKMKGDGFRYLKSKMEIIKRTKNFVFRLMMQKDRWNRSGGPVVGWIHCSVSDAADEIHFWGKTLARSNSKVDQFENLPFYPENEYRKSIEIILSIVQGQLLPFFRRFENDLQALVNDITDVGFSPFSGPQEYDAAYKIPIKFLEKYGDHEKMTAAFQNYYDRHQLSFVRRNLKNAIALLKEGKEVVSNGEKDYAEYAVKNHIELSYG